MTQKLTSERFLQMVAKSGLVDEKAIPRVVTSVKDALTGKITDDPRIQGDAMPPQGTRLSSQRVQLIQDWIVQGANP